jgi:GNAT superfamily N-acetyltransferase
VADLVVREAGPADRDAIRDVTLAAYQEYATRMPTLWDDYRQSIVGTLAAVGPAAQLVAERDGVIVGTVLLYPPGPIRYMPDREPVDLEWPEVRLLAVAPAARGQGVARALMAACMTHARRTGATALQLHTTDMMQAAIRLYEGMGFTRWPELDFHPGPSLTVKGYRLDLGGAPS